MHRNRRDSAPRPGFVCNRTSSAPTQHHRNGPSVIKLIHSTVINLTSSPRPPTYPRNQADPTSGTQPTHCTTTYRPEALSRRLTSARLRPIRTRLAPRNGVTSHPHALKPGPAGHAWQVRPATNKISLHRLMGSTGSGAAGRLSWTGANPPRQLPLLEGWKQMQTYYHCNDCKKPMPHTVTAGRRGQGTDLSKPPEYRPTRGIVFCVTRTCQECGNAETQRLYQHADDCVR